MAVFTLDAGPLANHLHGVADGNVTGSSADLLYPWSNLERAFAIDAHRPGRFASPPEADEYITIDTNRVRFSGAEGLAMGPLVSDPRAWVKTLDGPAANVTVISSPVKNGTRAFQLTADTGEGGVEGAAIHQDIQIRAGEVGTVEVWIRSDGTVTANVTATVLETGAVVLNATESGSTYALKAANFTAPAYTKQKRDGLWTLRVRCWITDAAAGDIFMDDFVYWPHRNTVAMIGHNLMPVLSAFELRLSTDAFAANDTLDTTVAEPINAPNFYAFLGGMRTQRWVRFKTTGTNPPAPVDRPGLGAIWFGQPWLLQRHEFDRSPNYGFREVRARSFVGNITSGGGIRRTFKEDTRRTDLAFSWRNPDDTDFDEVVERIFERAQYGDGPALVIRDSSKADSAHMVWTPGEMISEYIEAIDARDVRELILPGCGYPSFTG